MKTREEELIEAYTQGFEAGHREGLRYAEEKVRAWLSSNGFLVDDGEIEEMPIRRIPQKPNLILVKK